MATFQGEWEAVMSWVQVAVEMKMGQVYVRLDEPGARSVLTTDEATKVS
jgi:hypothetical protein